MGCFNRRKKSFSCARGSKTQG